MDIKASPAALIYQNLKKDFLKGIEEASTVSEPLYQTVSSTSTSNVYGWLGHIPGFREWKKNEARNVRNVESQDYTVANKKYENTIAVDVDDVNDNQLGSYAALAKTIGITGKQLFDELIFGMFNNGFGTQTCYDGLSWFNDAHTVGLSTVDNNLGALALDESNLETALTRLRSFTVQPDKLSAARPLNPDSNKLILLVPPALEQTARKLIMLKTVANGGENHLYGAADLMVTSYLTSSTAWFLLNVGASMKPCFLQVREKMSFRQLTPNDSDDAFLRDRYLYGAKQRLAALPTLPWLACGSTGS